MSFFILYFVKARTGHQITYICFKGQGYVMMLTIFMEHDRIDLTDLIVFMVPVSGLYFGEDVNRLLPKPYFALSL